MHSREMESLGYFTGRLLVLAASWVVGSDLGFLHLFASWDMVVSSCGASYLSVAVHCAWKVCKMLK